RDNLDEKQDPARYEQVFSIADGALSCRMLAEFGSDGVVTAEIEMTANRDFRTNRAGFTVLHPLDGVAGHTVVVKHSDGSEEHSSFPRQISPGQPAMDIVGLNHRVNGVGVGIAFSGEAFEMEDQRNWTDASFKTYCVPLKVPFTYTIAKGETVRQSIRITAEGDPPIGVNDRVDGLEIARGEEFPQIALALEKGWEPSDENIATIADAGVKSLQIRIGPELDQGFLDAAGNLGIKLEANFDVEIVLASGTEPAAGLRQAAAGLKEAGIAPKRVIALPESYLKSYQPSGPWPDGPKPGDCIAAARSVFSDASIGGGMLTNFTEFNRCRPDPAQCDYVTHSMTAIVHAADDLSVTETLEAMPYVFESAVDIANGKPYRLGLATIGMRSNPYGADVADNPKQTRGTMAMFDPRQRGLFGAAFAVGALASTQNCPVDAIALAGPAGPFAIIAEPQSVPRPYFDETPQAVVYPVYHVVRAAAAMSGRPRLAISGLGPGMFAIGVEKPDGAEFILANLGNEPTTVALPASGRILTLGTGSFTDAVADSAWLANAARATNDSVRIEPSSIAFVSGVAL
ncbi:MAG: hypothetical protein AAFN51_06720, partial [Pseudomonadota bacterium]